MSIDPISSKTPGPATAEPASGTKLQVNRAAAQAVAEVNSSQVFGQNNELTFAVDRASKRTVIRLVDKNTGEVVRQIPSETILHLAEALKNR
ncbi:MAG: flagellar protein FlaG [Ignavibacteriota bacterium]